MTSTLTARSLLLMTIAALRDGTYQQGHCELRTRADRFCCLGVMTDKAKDALGLEWKLDSYAGYSIGGHRVGAGDNGAYPPIEVLTKVFNFHPDGLESLPDWMREATSMNDGGASFESIADFLEREVLPLYPEKTAND